ncbi:unnamed protein product [Hyaloperonospora brassicae]|uniref:THH1/TOM1/TOM3 domain-containing protein n=1 Tax=Hyaloperonospora brassicae TaxID=162125 RepID=A0AAV0TC77_HYABA|nr:unnamed protein product [Hyaloperonospora brassicae]
MAINGDECKLLDGEFAALLQVLLGLIAFSVLVFKRLREVPRRPLIVWSFDASKQMIGATFAHVANLGIALVLYSHQQPVEKADSKTVDQCALYFVNFTLDTTFGVVLNYVLLSALALFALRMGWVALQTTGDYGTPVQVRTWLLQVLSWIVVISTCKLMIAAVILVFQQPLGAFAVLLFKPLEQHPDVELVLVMIACPCLMNALQFWVQDSFLKKDVRDESFVVAQAVQSPHPHVDGESGKVPALKTPAAEKCSEPGKEEATLAVVAREEKQEAEPEVNESASPVVPMQTMPCTSATSSPPSIE